MRVLSHLYTIYLYLLLICRSRTSDYDYDHITDSNNDNNGFVWVALFKCFAVVVFVASLYDEFSLITHKFTVILLLLFLLSSFSTATPSARWMELNQNRPHARKWVRFENACTKFGVYHQAANRGPNNHLFRWYRNLTATLTAHIFHMKDDIHNRASALQEVSYVVTKYHKLWSTNGLKLDRNFAHPSYFLHYALLRGFADWDQQI